ncbi:Protein of unknown function DUF1997 [Stanieria cyanosphaera PCC 7437]|uniref:DUF1997 domain-containing protein n=1 Tax=Stanieria cyanosphaera (strain ATCC 29371 / PCC 7437) TaxID=111780 RepID=K9XUT8_STAC7|nr:DUF1997 domain-containing protein [Stanieria cyanosphaera]AFZ35824.1 Protein of unknown function DUF1997 [Stanieria cyanosphaera PCC 7437]
MQVCFKASETVEILIEEQEVPVQHYLRQPQRLVKAIANPQLMKQLAENLYELKMRSLNFMEIYHFQPIVILKVWSDTQGNVYLKSQACEIKGIEYINRRFSLQLKGILYPEINQNKTCLKGQADLEVKVELPPPLMLTPKPLLEMAGHQLLKSVLVRIKQKLVTQLLKDYHQWVTQEVQQEEVTLGNKISTDFGLT